MPINAEAFADERLSDFKLRMRIFNNAENENLQMMLKSSIQAVSRLVGADTISDELVELTFERARYLYHDALDEFQRNYQSEIESLYLAYKLGDMEEKTHDEREKV